MHPFKIVKDHGFQTLIKTGRPDYYIPSSKTISHDVKKVFVQCRQRIAKMLQEHDGVLNFATDAWTSPNHKAYVAVTVHFEEKGVPISMLLDLVQAATNHSGINLAAVFAKILEDFGISDKISA
jgi:coproporphyrinogen III oxidase